MLFIDNKYTRWYYGIISNARRRLLNTAHYTERHHIIPKSLGGNNSKDNLVDLTAREHFICHRLLTKMVSDKKSKYQMWNAFSAMLYWHNDKQERIKLSPFKYQLIKIQLSKQKSLRFSGEGNKMYGKTHSAEAKAKMSRARMGRVVTEETREKLRNREYRNTWSSSFMKNNNPNSKPGVRDKMAATFLEKYGVNNCSQIPKICEHCGKSVGLSNYSRWHGNNCKTIKN